MDSSDKNRRTLTEALCTGKLSEEALTFLAGTAPSPPRAQPPAFTTEPPAPTPNPALPTNPSPVEVHPNPMPTLTLPQHPVVIPAIVSMTFRLPASLVAQLARVSAERKLRRDRPFHQQDIVAEALRQWLGRPGILDGPPPGGSNRG